MITSWLQKKLAGYFIFSRSGFSPSRLREHERAVFLGNWDDSALAKHCQKCQEGIDWDNYETISTQPYYYRCAILEALEIQREEVSRNNIIINDRAGLYVTTDAWKPFFLKIGGTAHTR